MRRISALVALALSACSTASDEAPTVDPTLPIASPPIARCMNMGSALEAMFEGEWGYTVRREDLERIKAAGFDTIRLPVRWTAHAMEAPPYSLAPDMLARVQEITGWAESTGLNIIINVHHYDELNEAPEQHERRLEAIWDQLAAAFADAPEHVIFETIHEPHTRMTVARTDALNKRLLQRIRIDNPDRWVILGTANWGNLDALQASRPDYDSRVMLTLHNYSPFEFTHQGAPWADAPRTGVRWGTRTDLKEMRADLDDTVEVQNQLRMPVFVGEFGVYEGVSIAARVRWTRAMRTEMEARGLSWCYWDYAGSLKAYDIEAEAWIPELKAALLD